MFFKFFAVFFLYIGAANSAPLQAEDLLQQTDVIIVGIYAAMFSLGFIAGQQR